jgi:hypothetical protein
VTPRVLLALRAVGFTRTRFRRLFPFWKRRRIQRLWLWTPCAVAPAPVSLHASSGFCRTIASSWICRPSVEHEELTALRREVRDQRRANEILKVTSVFFARELDQPRPR